jgi:hypothetical protein
VVGQDVLTTVEDGWAVFSFSLAPLDEIFGTEKRYVCCFEFCESSSIGRIVDREVSRFLRSLDTDRAAGREPACYVDPELEGGVLVGRDLLNDAHPVCRLRVPNIPGKQVSHGIGPANLPTVTFASADSGMSAMWLLLLLIYRRFNSFPARPSILRLRHPRRPRSWTGGPRPSWFSDLYPDSSGNHRCRHCETGYHRPRSGE